MSSWRKQVGVYVLVALVASYFAGTAMAFDPNDLTIPGGCISGLVWHDCKGNQHFTPEDGDYGIPGVLVTLYRWSRISGPQESYDWVKMSNFDPTYTDESGRYMFGPIHQVGDYKVVVGSTTGVSSTVLTTNGGLPVIDKYDGVVSTDGADGALTGLTPTWDYDESYGANVSTPHQALVQLNQNGTDLDRITDVDFGYTDGSCKKDKNCPPPHHCRHKRPCRPPSNGYVKPPCCPSKPGSSCNPPKGNSGHGSCKPPSSPKPGSSCTPPKGNGGHSSCKPPSSPKPGSSCTPPKGNGGHSSCTPPSSPKPGSSCTPPKGNGGHGSCNPPSSPKPGSSCTPPKGNGGHGSCTPPSSPKPGSSCTPPKGNSGGGSCNTPSNPKSSQPASNTSSGSSKGGSSCSPAPKSQPAKSNSSCNSKGGNGKR